MEAIERKQMPTPADCDKAVADIEAQIAKLKQQRIEWKRLRKVSERFYE